MFIFEINVLKRTAKVGWFAAEVGIQACLRWYAEIKNRFLLTFLQTVCNLWLWKIAQASAWTYPEKGAGYPKNAISV